MRRSIRAKLLGAVAFNVCFVSILGLFAGSQLASMNASASAVHRQSMPALTSAETALFSLAKYRLLQIEYLVNISSSDRRRIEEQMAQLEQHMANQLRDLHDRTAASERPTVDALEREWAAFVAQTHERFLPNARLTNTGSVQPAFGRLGLQYQELVGLAQALVHSHQQHVLTATDATQRTYGTARLIIAGATIFISGITAAVGLTLASAIAGNLAKMTAATQVVARGDLEHPVEVHAEDEIGVLARNFNEMVASLRQHEALLTSSNAELQQALARQEQLTQDLVERTRAEQAASAARSAAEEANQAKTLFLATMSHELRTPLNAILGYTQILALEARMQGQQRIHADLEKIQRAGKHLLLLISNILDLSKIEQGKMDVALEAFDLAVLIDEVAEMVSPLADKQRNRLLLEIGQLMTPMISDATKVRQLLFNLLSNAAKFTTAGTITLSASTEQRESGLWAVLMVRDTGIGIDPDDLPRLFEPFTQADASTTRRFGGSGLGLAICRHFCQLLGGTIVADSAIGCGSTFSVYLPLLAPHDTAATACLPAPPALERNIRCCPSPSARWLTA